MTLPSTHGAAQVGAEDWNVAETESQERELFSEFDYIDSVAGVAGLKEERVGAHE